MDNVYSYPSPVLITASAAKYCYFATIGYLGDRMEDNCHIVKQMSLPRRVGDAFTNSLDSILFMTTYVVMVRITHAILSNCIFYVTGESAITKCNYDDHLTDYLLFIVLNAPVGHLFVCDCRGQ